MRHSITFALLFLALAVSAAFAADEPFAVSLQTRNPTGKALHALEKWLPSRTAVIV